MYAVIIIIYRVFDSRAVCVTARLGSFIRTWNNFIVLSLNSTTRIEI